MLRKDTFLRLTNHLVTSGVLSSNMGPTGPRSLRVTESSYPTPKSALSWSLGGVPPCPLTPGDCRDETWQTDIGRTEEWIGLVVGLARSRVQTSEMEAKMSAALAIVC